ncbi:MAG: hypothetical protein IPI49_00335 [Myxococcales bacterium]|nr:hypothetical protein [Myxococcales bacterium]
MTPARMVRWVRDATLAERAFVGTTLVLLAVGAWFRVSGALTTPLWSDEARQAIALGEDLELADLAAWPLNLRPVLYLLLGKASSWIVDAEWILRLPSLAPSLASLVVTLALARQVLVSRVAVLVSLAVVALGPWLIDFAKEYKPYALEHFLVTLQVYLTVKWLSRRDRANLRALLPLVALGPLLGFACVFVAPCVLLVLAADAWRRRDRRTLALAVGAAVMTLALFAVQYLLFQRHATKMSFQYWDANFYDAGFRLRTLGAHLWDILGQFPAGEGPPLVRRFAAGVHVVLFGIGLGVLVARRRWALLLLIAGPLLLPIGASLAGRWPYGMVRVNLYMIGLVALTWTVALDAAITSPRLRWAGLAASAVVVALQLPTHPRLLLDKQVPAAHMRPILQPTDMPSLLAQVLAAESRALAAGGEVCVHVSAEARPVFLYYTRDHDDWAAAARGLRVGRWLAENSRLTMLEMSAALRGPAQPCWMVRSYRYDEQLAARRVLKEDRFRVLAELQAPGLVATKIERVARPPAAAPPSAGEPLTLAAEDAVLAGDGLWYYGRARIGGMQGVDPRWASEAIGNWSSLDSAVSWTFELAQAGEFEVLVSQAAADGAGGSYVVDLGGQRLTGEVVTTPTWQAFTSVSLGRLPLQPGRHTLLLRATTRRGTHVMNLRGLQLRPR